MENNDNKNLSLLEILAKKSNTYNQELDARTNAITEGLITNQNHWDGTAKFSPTAIAKENAAREEMVKTQEKYKQAADHILQESPSDAPLTAVSNYTQALKVYNDRERAMQSLSEKDRIILLGHPDLQHLAHNKHIEMANSEANADKLGYTDLDVMADQRSAWGTLSHGLEALKEGGKDLLKSVAATPDIGTHIINRALMSDEALKQAGDIERKVALQKELRSLAEQVPSLRDYFLEQADNLGLTVEDHAFLSSEEGAKYRSAQRSLNDAATLLTSDMSNGLVSNQRSLERSFNNVVKTFKNQGIFSGIGSAISSLVTNLPEVTVAAIQSLPTSLAISGNPAVAATGLVSIFSKNITESLNEIRAQGKAIDEINYGKAVGLSILAGVADAIGDRLLGAGYRTITSKIPGSVVGKWGKEYERLYDDFISKGLTTDQAANAAMKIIGPNAISEFQRTFNELGYYAKKGLSELGDTSTALGRALRNTGKGVATTIDALQRFGFGRGLNPVDWAKEMGGEGIAEATGSALQNLAQGKEVTAEGFLKDALLGGATGLGMQGPMAAAGWGQRALRKLAEPKFTSDSDFNSSMEGINNILESTDYDNFDNINNVLQESLALQEKNTKQLKEVNEKQEKYVENARKILESNGISSSLITDSGQFINPENSGLSGSDLKEYTKLFKGYEQIHKVQTTLEERSKKLSELEENISYIKAGKGHSREFSKVEQLSNLQMAEDQATSDRAKDFEALSDANKVKYMQQYEGMKEDEAKEYVANLDTEYTAADIISNAKATNIDAQKLQENIDYYGIDANHLNQIKDAKVLEALANIDDTQASVDNYNEAIKNAGLEKHKDLYRRVSTPKESENSRSEAIQKAKFNTFDKKLGKPTGTDLDDRKTALKDALEGKGIFTDELGDVLGYIHYSDPAKEKAFIDSLNSKGKKVYQDGANFLDNSDEIRSLEQNYYQYHNRHTKSFNSEQEAKKAVGSNKFLKVKEDPYAPGRWVVKSVYQEFRDAISIGSIRDIDSLKNFITTHDANILSQDDVKFIDEEVKSGKSFKDIITHYNKIMSLTHVANMQKTSTRVKEAMGVLGYGAESLNAASFSGTVRTARKAAAKAKEAQEQETKKTEKVNKKVDYGFNFLKEKQLTDLKTKKLTKEEEENLVESIHTYVWSNLFADKSGKVTVSTEFAKRLAELSSLLSTEYYTKSGKADKVTSQKSIVMLNLESDTFSKAAKLINEVDKLIDSGIIGTKSSGQVFDNNKDTLSKHLYVQYSSTNSNEIATLTFKPGEATTKSPQIRIIDSDINLDSLSEKELEKAYANADKNIRDEATRDNIFNMLIANSKSIGNTGGISDGSRTINIELNESNVTVTENSLELQEDLFGIHQNATNYLHNNVIKNLASKNPTERNNAINQLKTTVEWFHNQLVDTTDWSTTDAISISKFSDLNGSINNNRAYFINNIKDPTQYREFTEDLYNALQEPNPEDVLKHPVVKALINNPNKFDKVFNSMNSPLGLLILHLAERKHENYTPSNDVNELQFTETQIDAIYNRCGNDPLTRNIVFNSIIWDTQLFTKISANGTKGAAGNMPSIKKTGSSIRKLLDETKYSGPIKVTVDTNGTDATVSTQDSFHVIKKDDANRITAAYTLTASMIFELGLQNQGFEIYTNDGRHLTNPRKDLQTIYDANSKQKLVKQVSNLFNGDTHGVVFRDFLKVDFITNSITKNPKLNTTDILEVASSPLKMEWEYVNRESDGTSNRANVMSFATELELLHDSLQQSYASTTFTTHKVINTIRDGKPVEFTAKDTRDQLYALADYVDTSKNKSINVKLQLQNDQINDYYKTAKSIEEAFISVNIWTDSTRGSLVTGENIRDFANSLNKKGVTKLSPEQRLVANFLIELGSIYPTFNNATSPITSTSDASFDRRKAHVDNPEFLYSMDNMVSNTKELKDNFKVDIKHGGIFNIPNIMHSLASGEEFPGITDTIEVSGLASEIAPLCIEANADISPLLNGKETEFNKEGLLRYFMREKNGSWYLPNNLLDVGICAVFSEMPSVNMPQSEEFKSKVTVALGKASPQVRMRASINLSNIKGVNKDELIKQVAMHIERSTGQFLIPKDSAKDPKVLYVELAGVVVEALSRKGYLKKTLLRTDPTASDAGQIITNEKDTKGCTIFYGLDDTTKANSVVAAVHNCVKFTPDGRTTHCILDSFGMESTSRNNYTVTSNPTEITEAEGNVEAHAKFKEAWNANVTRSSYGRTIETDNGKVVARYFEEIPNDDSNLHKWCQIDISTDDTEKWVTVPATALYSDRATNNYCTPLALKANATQYIQPQKLNVDLTTQIFGSDLAGFKVTSDGTVYHENLADFPCGIRLDLRATEQSDKFYAMFGLTEAIDRFRNAGSSTQQAEAEEALIAHYDNILDLLRCIVGQHEVYNNLPKKNKLFEEWLADREFHFHLKNSVNARVMYDSTFTPRDAKDYRMFFTTVRSKQLKPADGQQFTQEELESINYYIKRSRNLIIATNFDIAWDKTTEEFLDKPMDMFYEDLTALMRLDNAESNNGKPGLAECLNNGTAPTIEQINNFFNKINDNENYPNFKLGIKVPIFSKDAKDHKAEKTITKFTPSVGSIQCITEICTSESHLDGTYNENDIFYIRGEVDGITNGTAMLLGKANRMSDSLREDTSELLNKVGITLNNLPLFDIKSKQVSLGVGADAYLNQLIVTNSDIYEIINKLMTEQQASGKDANIKKDILEILSICFEVNEDLAPQLTRDLAKIQAMPYNYLAGRASRQQKLLESFCTEINRTLRKSDEATAKALLESLVRLNGNELTLHNNATGDVKLVTIDQVATLTQEELDTFSVDFGSMANEQVLTRINDEAAARFVEAPGVKLSPIAEEAMQDLAKGFDTYASLLLAELVEELNAHGGTLSHTQVNAIIDKYIRYFPGPGGSQNALNQQGISINKHNYKQVIEEFVNNIFVPVQGGGITVKGSLGALTSRGAGNVPMQVHMLDGTVVQAEIIKMGTKLYTLMIHDAVEGGITTILEASKGMNGTYGYITLTENPWNMASSMLQHAIDDIQGSTRETRTKTNIMENAAKLHNMLHPTQQPVTVDFAENMLTRLKAYSLESLIDRLNTIDEIQKKPNGTLAFNQYYGGKDTAWVLGQDDFEYIDESGKLKTIKYSDGRDKYFKEIKEVLITKHKKTQQLNSSAFALVKFIKQQSVNKNGLNSFPHLMYALAQNPAKVGNTATADLDLTTELQGLNYRNAEELLRALNPNSAPMGKLALAYHSWLNPNDKNATATSAWNAYIQEYSKLRDDFYEHIENQDLSSFVESMIDTRIYGTNTVGTPDDSDVTKYDPTRTREQLHHIFEEYFKSKNNIPANFAAAYGSTLAQYKLTTPADINKKIARNAKAHTLIHRKSENKNQLLAGFLALVANYKDTDQNSAELNWILENTQSVFSTDVQQDVYKRIVPYSTEANVTRIHIPVGEFNYTEWEAGANEAEQEAIANKGIGNIFCDGNGELYPRNTQAYRDARKEFRRMYFTNLISSRVSNIIHANMTKLASGQEVHLVIEGNSYFGAMLATALACHSFTIAGSNIDSNKIKVAMLPVEGTHDKLAENWTLGILNANVDASTVKNTDSVTIVAPQGDRPDPVLESMAHFYNYKANSSSGTSKSLNIPKWDIQGDAVNVGSDNGHNSGKLMSPELNTQSIIITKAGALSKIIDSDLVGAVNMTDQGYIDNKNMNDVPFLDKDSHMPLWGDYKTRVDNDGHNLDINEFNVGTDTVQPYSTLAININTAKLIQQGVLEGNDESSQKMLERLKDGINTYEITRKLQESITGKSKEYTQGVSIFNHSVKLGPSLVNVAFVPSAEFIAIPRKLLKNLTQDQHTNEYKMDDITINKELYYKLISIQRDNKFLHPNNPTAKYSLNSSVLTGNQVIVVSTYELGNPNDSMVKAIMNKSAEITGKSFFYKLQESIRNRAYRTLDIYADRVLNNRDATGMSNKSVYIFKDTDVEVTEYGDGKFLGSYSRVDLSGKGPSELTEFWNSIQPVTDIRNQAHREYSGDYYNSGKTIAESNIQVLGNNIHALHDDTLQDIAQSLYGVDQLKYLFNHPVLAPTDTTNAILESTINTILDTDIQVMIGIQNSFNRRNAPLAITGIDAHTGRQFVNISMQNVGSNIAENNREALAHEITHRVVAEGLKNENLLRQVRVLYEYVKDNISEDDFQCDYATRREIMDYVFPKHRTNVNVLQEFLAYALTNKHLIQAIANMRVDSATIEALNARTSGLFNKICAYVTDSAINRMDEPSVQKGICQLFADMAKIAKKNWTRPEERLKYADPSFGMDYTDIDKHPDLDATRGIPVGDKALLGAIAFDYKQAQGSYDEFIRYINRDDYSEEHLGNSAYTPESIGLTRWIENCCRKFSDNLYGFMNMLVPIMAGTTKSNQIYSKAALQLKVRVDQMRERLITAGTKYVRGLFDTCEIGDSSQISQDRRRAITDTILDTDFKTLVDTYKYEDIRDMVANPKKLNQEIQKLLNYPVIQKSATYYSNACKGLANRMVHGVDTSRLGLRNAYQIFNKWGSNNSTTSHYSADGVKQIDTLITLYAIQALSPENKERLLDLMELPKGEQLINGITTMHRQLMLKQERDIFSNDNNVYNIPKGWTHRLTDSDKSLQLIPRSSLEMYEYQGYEYVTDANVSPEIKRLFPKESDLVYVKHQHILNTPYVPGIAPTVRKHQQEGDQYTINLLGTGRLDLTIDPDLRQSEFQKAHGIHARQSKVMSTTQANHPITEYDTLLEPIFNTMGKIIGYNLRPNDKTLAKFTKEDTDADHILGTTLGNIAERHITPQLNQKTAENLDKIYTESKHKDRDFKWIGLNDTNEEVQLAYKMLPAEIRDYFQERYPGKGVPIEKQYFARIVGHKPISAGDIKELEKYYNKAMNAPMDYIKKAFHSKYAVAGEYWSKQMADIGKQALVIQSGTVTLYNWISNLMLLTMRGVSLQDAIQLQAKGWKQLQRYKELGQQIDDLKVKALMQPKIDISSKINGLQSEIENLDIYPLLKEGFYSSIATNEITSKDTLVESTLKALPQEIRNTMGYKGIANLLAAKGTTVHKWLQDLAVDSDFVGRYALYNHLKNAQFTDPVTGHTTTMSEDKRLGIINDMFIDYTVPLPKPIEWAEKVGLYVFSKYMFRTQKNLYSILTSNWQEVGKLAIAQMMLGGGAMGSNPFQSLMLPGQVLSHFNTPGGLALDGLSGLPLVRLLN